MKVLIIYDGNSKEYVEELRERIAEQFGHSTILRMHSRERIRDNKSKNKRKIVKHSWHRDACRMMKQADMIVYIVSPYSVSNKNVDWEISKAMKYKKHIVCLPDTNRDCTLIDWNKKGTLNSGLYIYDKLEKEEKCYAELLKNEDDLFEIISNYNSGNFIKLFNKEIDVEANKESLLEQYKIFSDTAEMLVTRRQNMHSFYITANTALITVGATVFALSDERNLTIKLFILLALSIPGFLLNMSWRQTLKSYFITHRGKMKVLSIIEKRLPVSLYDAEWKAMKNQYSKEKYVSFTDSEKNLPYIFIISYGFLDIVAIVFLFVLKDTP